MSSSEHIIEVISALESRRLSLGDKVVNTAVAVLQERLPHLLKERQKAKSSVPHLITQRKQVTVLFARITGLTQQQPFQRINTLWQHLDEVIVKHGGLIDKHLDNEVMALFGVPVAHEDDPERGVRAALAMRAKFAEFVRQWQEDAPLDSTVFPHIQIGLNTGRVLLDEVGAGNNEYTVIGDPVNIASRVQSAAPMDGILMAHDTYLLVRDTVTVEPLGPVAVKGKSDPIRVYLALGMQSGQTLAQNSRGIEGIETTMVGRYKELTRLQQHVQTTISTNQGNVITIVGNAGVGKSRLIYEFTRWLDKQPQAMTIFKGRAKQQPGQAAPLSLIRDMLTYYFNIQDNDTLFVASDKLVEGLSSYLDDEVEASHHVRALSRLIGIGTTDALFSNQLEASSGVDSHFKYLTSFFKTITAVSLATIIFLEDIHWADADSLAFIPHLVDTCQTKPILLICTTRPHLEEQAFPDFVQEKITLSPLSDAESHKLIDNILRKLPLVPSTLTQLIIKNAQGNPFYVEEIIKALIEDGIIITSAHKWQINPTQLNHIRIPPTLTGVLQARLDRLTSLELVTLQRAVIIGRVFWADALVYMNQKADDVSDALETRAALRALVKRELVFPRRVSAFANTEEYIFKHALLHDVTYESVLLRQRPVYHRLVAEWLLEMGHERMAEYAAPIARHYELAEDDMSAAELYELAGTYARDLQNPVAAIEYYSKALALIADQPHHALWQLRLQEELGALLKMQARFVEAIQTYLTMKFTAEIDGDLVVQARALNGLADLYREQANYTTILQTANEAERVAWLVGADLEMIQALLYQSEAHTYLANYAKAVETAKRAHEMSQELEDVEQMVNSLYVLCQVGLRSNQPQRIRKYLVALEKLIKDAHAQADTKKTALVKVVLAELYQQLRQYQRAGRHLKDALRLYQTMQDQPAMSRVLNALGETAQLNGHASVAINLYRKALSLAITTGNTYHQLKYCANLSELLITLQEYETAETELKTAINKFRNSHQAAPWFGLGRTYYLLAQAYQAQKKHPQALITARQAQAVAQSTGETWLLKKIEAML